MFHMYSSTSSVTWRFAVCRVPLLPECDRERIRQKRAGAAALVSAPLSEDKCKSHTRGPPVDLCIFLTKLRLHERGTYQFWHSLENTHWVAMHWKCTTWYNLKYISVSIQKHGASAAKPGSEATTSPVAVLATQTPQAQNSVFLFYKH